MASATLEVVTTVPVGFIDWSGLIDGASVPDDRRWIRVQAFLEQTRPGRPVAHIGADETSGHRILPKRTQHPLLFYGQRVLRYRRLNPILQQCFPAAAPRAQAAAATPDNSRATPLRYHRRYRRQRDGQPHPNHDRRRLWGIPEDITLSSLTNQA